MILIQKIHIIVMSTLKKSMVRHLSEATVSADQLQVAADACVTGSPLPTKELARYLLQLALGVGVDTSALHAGVANHFLRWCGETSDLTEATYETVVREMQARDVQARAYLASCEQTDKVRIRHGDRDEESEIALSVTGNRCRQNAKVDGGIAAMARCAETLWETSIQLHIE